MDTDAGLMNSPERGYTNEVTEKSSMERTGSPKDSGEEIIRIKELFLSKPAEICFKLY